MSFKTNEKSKKETEKIEREYAEKAKQDSIVSAQSQTTEVSIEDREAQRKMDHLEKHLDEIKELDDLWQIRLKELKKQTEYLDYNYRNGFDLTIPYSNVVYVINQLQDVATKISYIDETAGEVYNAKVQEFRDGLTSFERRTGRYGPGY